MQAYIVRNAYSYVFVTKHVVRRCDVDPGVRKRD